MTFPPSIEQVAMIAMAIRVEIKGRPAWWCGGTIFSGIPGYFADVDRDGNFKRIFYKEGDRKEYFQMKE
mgnify:CR=1 FL=1